MADVAHIEIPMSDSEAASTAPPTPRAIPSATFSLRKRHPGRRKLRRWRNDDHVLLPVDEDTLYEHLEVPVEWRSSWDSLTGGRGMERERELMRSGAMPAPRRNIPRQAGGTWAKEEARWVTMQRSTRDTVTRAMKSPSVFALVEALEAALVYFVQLGLAPAPESVAESLAISLVEPLRRMDDGRLAVALADSPFKRLLLHALCQFYDVRTTNAEAATAATATLPAGEVPIEARPVVVLVQRPSPQRSHLVEMSMVAFLLATRLHQAPEPRPLADAAAVGTAYASTVSHRAGIAKEEEASRAPLASTAEAAAVASVALRPAVRRSAREVSPGWVVVGDDVSD